MMVFNFHILLGMEKPEPIQEENIDLEIVSDDDAKIETDFLTSQITVKNNNGNGDSSVNREIERMKQQFLDSICNVKTMAQVDVVKKCIAPIKPRLQALEACSSQITYKHLRTIPANKKILPQRRFYSTKKTRKPTKPAMRKPNYSETQNIALSLINTFNTL